MFSLPVHPLTESLLPFSWYLVMIQTKDKFLKARRDGIQS